MTSRIVASYARDLPDQHAVESAHCRVSLHLLEQRAALPSLRTTRLSLLNVDGLRNEFLNDIGVRPEDRADVPARACDLLLAYAFGELFAHVSPVAA
jgi:uncharacterized protein YjiS (DUF1127 family)